MSTARVLMKVLLAVAIAIPSFLVAGCGTSLVSDQAAGLIQAQVLPVASLEVVASPTTVAAGGTDRVSVSVRAFNTSGILVGDGAQVSASVSAGTMPPRVTLQKGVGTVLLTPSRTPNENVVITVRSGVATASTVVRFADIQPAEISFSISSIPGSTDSIELTDFVVRSGEDIRAGRTREQILSGQGESPFNVDDNQAIVLSVFPAGLGSFSRTSLTLVDAVAARSGQDRVIFTLADPGNPDLATGVNAFISASIGNAVSTIQQQFPITQGTSVTGGTVSGVTQLGSVPVRVSPSQTAQVPLRAALPNVTDPTQVTFSANPGTGITFTQGVLDSVTSSVLTTMNVPVGADLSIAGQPVGDGLVVAVSATALGQTQNLPVIFRPATPTPQLITLSVSPSQIATPPGGSLSATLTARVQASDGTFPSDIQVTFGSQESLGVIFPTTAVTQNGIAQATFSLSRIPLDLIQSGRVITFTATVPKSTIGATAQLFLSPTFGSPERIRLAGSTGQSNPSTETIFILGSAFPSTSSMTFEILDENDNIVRSSTERVEFILEDGGLGGGEQLFPSAGTAATTGSEIINGEASTVLRSGVKAGTVRVIAFIDNRINNGRPDPGEPRSEITNISISGGLPDGQNLSLLPGVLNFPGLIQAGLTGQVVAFLADQFSNPVVTGTRVSFTTFDDETLEPAAFIDASGATGVADSQISVNVRAQPPEPVSGFVRVQGQTQAGSGSRILSLVQDPSNAGIVYAGTDGGGVYKGRLDLNNLNLDFNLAWTHVGTARSGLFNGYIRDLAVDPRIDPTSSVPLSHIIYAATDGGVFRSTGGGGFWEERSGRGRIVNASIANGGLIATGDPQGFNLRFPSTLQRARTEIFEGNIQLTDFTYGPIGASATGADRDPSSIFFRSTTPVAANLRVSYDYFQGLPEEFPISALVLSPNSTNGAPPTADNAIVYAGTLGDGVYRSNDGGFTWTQIASGLTNLNVTSLALVQDTVTNNVILFAGTRGGGIFKATTTDVAGTFIQNEPDPASTNRIIWQPANLGLTATNIISLATPSPLTRQGGAAFLIAGSDTGGVFRADVPAGSTLFDTQASQVIWSQANMNVDQRNLANTRIQDLVVDDLGTVYAATSDNSDPANPLGGVFRSTAAVAGTGAIGSAPLSMELLGGASSGLETRLFDSITAQGAFLFLGANNRQVWLSRNPGAAADQVTFEEVGRRGSTAVSVTPPLDNTLYASTRILLSGFPQITITPHDPAVTELPEGTFQRFFYTVSDDKGNPLPAGTQITVTVVGQADIGGATVDAAEVGGDVNFTLSDRQGGKGSTDFTFDLNNVLPRTVDVGGGPVPTPDVSVTATITVSVPVGEGTVTASALVTRRIDGGAD